MKTRRFIHIILLFTLLPLLGSCGIYTKYQTPRDTELTRSYAEAREMAIDSSAFGNLLWEQVFTDPVLADLISRALYNNVDLENARLNVTKAQAQLKGAKLAYLPSLALAPNGSVSSIAGSKASWSYQLPAQLSWEIDIFGKLLNSKRAAKAQLMQTEAYQQAVRSQIITAVANTYYAIVSVKAQLELSRSTSVLWSESVQTMKDMKEAGRTTEAAVVQSTANYYAILGSITDLESSLVKLENTMCLLVKTMPGSLEVAVSPQVSFEVPPIVRTSIPMAELSVRPDVQAAEMSLATAFYQTNSARAAFYPGLNITAAGGFTNLLGSMIKNPGEWFWQIGGQLTMPLFSRGRNIANLEAAKATQKQALNNFEYSIMNASAEVSNALTVYEKSTEKLQYLEKQVENLQKSVSYTQELMRYSTTRNTTYLEVLTAQQSLLNAQISKISSELSRAQAVITLYQSLGGGR